MTGLPSKYQPFAILTAAVLFAVSLLAASGCTARVARFRNAPPVLAVREQPSPVPERSEYEATYYYLNNLVRRPVVGALSPLSVPRAGDVNSLDDLPASSWFTPRIGYREVTPGELVRGPADLGPPELPMTVARLKSAGSNPGFIVEDSRGITYLLKFDLPDYPGIQTTTGFVVNRLFWGFGYNVPEDHQLLWQREDLRANPEAGITERDVEEVLARVPRRADGRYRSLASRFLQGEILGPIAEEGVREGDPNDVVPHEDRRSLRGLRMLCAFTNHADIRIDNSLDVYEGEPGRGHVRHYLLDFGEAFGGHGAEHDWLWDGYSHRVDYRDMLVNLVSLGLKRHGWEHIHYTPFPSVGAFEAEHFQPGDWKETYQFLPIQRARPDDDYWSAKIIAALTREHLTALLGAAEYPDPGAEAYVLRTLLERREKVLDHAFTNVTPLDAATPLERITEGTGLLLLNRAIEHGVRLPERVGYEVQFFSSRGEPLGEPTRHSGGEGWHLTIPVPDRAESGEDYVIVEVWSLRGGERAPRAARFHLAALAKGGWRLAGVQH